MLKDLIRRIKGVYALYNFFHRKQLLHNVALYKKYGLNKTYYSPVSSKDFLQLQGDAQAARTVSLSQLQACKIYQDAGDETRQSLEAFAEQGYAILPNYLTDEMVERLNEEMEELLKNRIVEQGAGGKIMFAIEHAALLKKLGSDAALLELISVLMDGKASLFQSINFLKGSEQATHSDSIHMTTFPLGGLAGVWIALEDIHAANGPLHYYPGSHRLPYYLNADYNNEGSYFLLGSKDYKEYEEFMRLKIEELQLTKKKFCVPKGTMMIWHANLFHGGEKQTDPSASRKSVVFHYFDRNSICYHEITQRPALLKFEPLKNDG